jgi:hypothetical protein
VPFDILQAQARELRGLQTEQELRAVEITSAALGTIKKRLDREDLGTWNAFVNTAALQQLSQGIRDLAQAHVEHTSSRMGAFFDTARKDTAEWLRYADRTFTGSVRPLRFDAVAWVSANKQQLSNVRLQEYRRSFARYGANAVRKIENEIAQTVLIGDPWSTARDKVWDAVRGVVEDRQWMVDRILRTETSAIYNGTRLEALLEEDYADDPMYKTLLATFDNVTGDDSVLLHEQVRPVRQPFYDAWYGKSYMAPPNRPNDREILVGWRKSYGDAPGEVAPERAGQDDAPSVRSTGSRTRRLKSKARVLDQQILALAAASEGGDPSASVQAEVLRSRRDRLLEDARSSNDVSREQFRRLRLAPKHVALLRVIRARGKVRRSPELSEIKEAGLVVEVMRGSRPGFVLTAAGLDALNRQRQKKKKVRAPLTSAQTGLRYVTWN